MAGAEREIGMPAFCVGLETDRDMALLSELLPACEIRTPMLVTKTAVAAKSPIWAAHRCEIIASSATPFFLIFRREVYSELHSVLGSLALFVNLYIPNPRKRYNNSRHSS
jgi:hypothetical protein